MADDIDRILALIEKLAATVGEQAQIIERLDARVRELERRAADDFHMTYQVLHPFDPRQTI